MNEILPGGPRAAVAKLAEIETEILNFKRDRLSMPIERFMEIMGEISQIAKLYGLEPTAVEYKKRGVSGPVISINFMKEVLSQDSPLWDSEILSKKIADILLLMSGIGAGFIPMIGDAVDLHEFLTGKDYFTQTKLSFGERVLSAAGLLAGSGTGWRTVAEGIDKTLDDARLARRLGRSEIAEANRATIEAESFLGSVLKDNGQLGNRRITVLGSRQDTLVAKDWPNHNVLNLPDGQWNWPKNKQWLDDAIKGGDEIYLATTPEEWRRIRPSSVYFDELEYLKNKGFIQEGNRMVRK